MEKIKCFLGLHKWKFVTWSKYEYSLDAFTKRSRKQAINKCECCGKYSKPPVWYKKEYREMYPFVGLDGFRRNWNPEIKEIAEL